MALQTIQPYISIGGGKGREAIALYEKALGAKAERLMKWDECPMDIPAERKGLVMHCEIAAGELKIMLCDSPEDAAKGGQVSITLGFADAESMTKSFEILAEGGKVIMPIDDAFWGDKFGMLHDRFGVKWMFVCPQKG
ncbi:MAG: glyoxalase/bleomycin resistance/extradiol dioxygenase family protein [Bryobacterales bacterium]